LPNGGGGAGDEPRHLVRVVIVLQLRVYKLLVVFLLHGLRQQGLRLFNTAEMNPLITTLAFPSGNNMGKLV
jgi:hypothetical protein